jgi:cytochrome c oxidase subunit IV
MSEHHITPLKTYLAVAGTLFFLTAVTVWVSYFDFGSIQYYYCYGRCNNEG